MTDTLDAIAREMREAQEWFGIGPHVVKGWADRITALSNQGEGDDPDDLPVPAFRIVWSESSVGRTYGPNNTDCFTADQLHAVRNQALHEGQCAVLHANSEADRRDAERYRFLRDADTYPVTCGFKFDLETDELMRQAATQEQT